MTSKFSRVALVAAVSLIFMEGQVAGQTTNYPVTIHITGVAFLIGNKGDATRKLVVPNLTAANPRHAPLLRLADQQMHMLRHEDIPNQPKPIFPPYFPQDFQKQISGADRF